MSNLTFSAKVRTITSSSSLKAFATLIIDDVIAIEGYKIFDGRNGLFVTPPSHKGIDKDGAEKYYNDVNYLEERDEDNRRGPVETAVSDAILAEYKRSTSPKTTSTRPGTAQAGRQNPTGGRPTTPGRSAPQRSKPDPISEDW